MHIINLRAFVVVAEVASFSLAAEALHLTQPAVSKRIAALESELATRLFDRLGRKVLLTEAGHTLLPRARRILAEVDDSRRALQNLSFQVTGTLTLATSHHIGLHRLPPVLRSYTGLYPEVALDIRFMDSELACDAVAQGAVELGIVTLPPQPQSPLTASPIWIDRLLVVVNRDHPLTEQQKVSPTQLRLYPAILPGKTTFTRGIIQRTFAEQKFPFKIAFSTNYLETIRTMVMVGLGWSILPHTMLNDELVALEVDAWRLERALGVVSHSQRTLSNAARGLLALLKERAEEE